MCPDTAPPIAVASDRSAQDRAPAAVIRLLRQLERSTDLDPVVAAVEPVAGRIIANEPIRRLLHGDSTGIPLHVILTDAPLGAWYMALFLDLFPDHGTRRAATRLVGLGLVTAVPTAAAGWAEWARADRGARRVGIVHATTNAAGTLIFLGSWAARSRGRHHLGVQLGRLGGSIFLVGSFLGGYMRSDRPAVPKTGQPSEPETQTPKAQRAQAHTENAETTKEAVDVRSDHQGAGTGRDL